MILPRTSDLRETAEKNGIPVLSFSLPITKSMSVQADDGSCAIGVDPGLQESSPEYLVRLAHELGHCMTGSFYNRYSSYDIREKHENRANKWAAVNLISESELDSAVAQGYTEIWSLAEYFGVPEPFMRKVVCWYTFGNMSDELFF